ncbi:MAG: Clp protease N-terminal domain-containing protein [Hyphomicrobiaceae bacterium]
MPQAFSEEVGWIPTSSVLSESLARAERYASEQLHRAVTLEHLLLALTEDTDATAVLLTCGIDITELQSDLAGFLGRLDARHTPGEAAPPVADAELMKVLRTAAEAARQVRRSQIDGAIVLAALVGEGKSSAAEYLKRYGLTFEGAVRSLQKRGQRPKPEVAPSPPEPPAPAVDQAPVADAHPPPPAVEDIPDVAPGPTRAERAAETVGTPELAPWPEQTIEPDAPPPVAEPREEVAEPRPDAGAERAPQAAATRLPATPAAARVVEPAPPAPAAMSEEDILAAVQEERARLETRPPLPPHEEPIVARPLAVERRHRDERVPEVGRLPSQRAPVDEAPALDVRRSRAAADLTPPSRPQPVTGAPVPEAAVHAPAPRPRIHPGPPGPVPMRRDMPPTDPIVPPAPYPAYPSPPLPTPRRHGPAGDAPRPSPFSQGHAPDIGAGADMRDGPPRQMPPTMRMGQQRPDLRAPASPPAMHADGTGVHQVPAIRRGGVLEPGQLVENIPRRMLIGKPEIVEVRIARSHIGALGEGLQGGGVAHHHEVQVTKAMSVRLRSPDGGFQIEPGSPETQWIDNTLGLLHDDYASWRWTLTPRRRGKGRLQLLISARTIGKDGVVAETALPDQVIEIRVVTNYAKLAVNLAGWAAVMVAGGVLQAIGSQYFGGGLVTIVKRLFGG